MINRKIVASVAASLSLLAAPSAHGANVANGAKNFLLTSMGLGAIGFGAFVAHKKISKEDLFSKLKEKCSGKFKKLTEVLKVIKLEEGAYMLKACGEQIIVYAKDIKDGVVSGYNELSEVTAQQHYEDCKVSGVLSGEQFSNALKTIVGFIAGTVKLNEFAKELTSGAGGFVIRFAIKSVFGNFF